MIELNIADRIATITLNRPEKRNALDDVMASELLQMFNKLRNDDNCKVLILKAIGEAFCAGADLGYLQKLQNNSYEENLNDSMALMEMFKALYTFPKVTIAQVEGPAFAGGCGLAGLCDFCFSTPEALFAYTEVKIGFIPAIVSVFLGPKIGDNRAKKMLLTGEVFNANEALELGIITKIIKSDTIESEVLEYALKLTRSVSSQSIAATKSLLIELKGLSIEEQLLLAARANAKARESIDCKRGISSFLNKEKLNW